MINKIVINVPPGIRFLRDWAEFHLTNFQEPSILNKQLPGCGFTEFALTCPEPVVLCSPRKMLMENKKDQHGDDVYLVVNDYEVENDIDEDISKSILSKSIESKDKYIADMLGFQAKEESNQYTKLFNEISNYIFKMNHENKPVKIIVTYDSTYLIKKILKSMNILELFYFCVDEMQSILDDSRFKSSTELNFLETLRDIRRILYTSATPMLDKYLQQIPELSNLPYYQLDWSSLDSTRVRKPNLKVRTMKSLSGKMEEIIHSYLNGNFEKVIVERSGELIEVESKEAVFYVNSVNHIIGIIKKMNLKPEQVNILCSDTPFNKSRILKKLGKKSGFFIGSVPLRGEPHKMFTFCTRTVYLGADFYSTCARSFIFSDSNSDCLAVDISMDLYQILGRERDNNNPWKGSAEFYYRTTADYKKMTREDFLKRIEEKKSKTNSLIRSYFLALEEDKKNLADTYLKVTKMDKYRDNYVSVNNDTPVFNNLVFINDQRAFDIQQIDYVDRFSVFSSLEKHSISQESFVNEFFSIYDSLTTYVEKIHCIVDHLLKNPDHQDTILNNLVDTDKIKQQIVTLGPLRIKGLGYNLTYIKKAMGITIFDQSSLDSAVNSSFKEGQRYTNKFIKKELGVIYKSADYDRTPKTGDLEQWFEVRKTQITINGIRENGLLILKKR